MNIKELIKKRMAENRKLKAIRLKIRHEERIKTARYSELIKGKRQRTYIKKGKANISANKGGTSTLSNVDKEAHNTRNVMAADLVTIFHAGLLPNNKHKENKSASALCHSISLGISIQALEPDFLKEYDSDNNPVTKKITNSDNNPVTKEVT